VLDLHEAANLDLFEEGIATLTTVRTEAASVTRFDRHATFAAVSEQDGVWIFLLLSFDAVTKVASTLLRRVIRVALPSLFRDDCRAHFVQRVLRFDPHL
jgi:hypothetical protein